MHSDLIAKLEALDGPNWEIEREIGVTIDREQWLTRGRLNLPLPKYTASLDATVALVERVLPGWDWAVSNLGEDGCEGKMWKHGWYDDTWVRAFHTHPTIALLIAALKALGARDG